VDSLIKKDRYVVVSNDFMRDNNLSMVEKSLYMILASYCKEGEKICSPSIRGDLVPVTGVTAKTIINTLDKLKDKGYIDKVEQVDTKGGRLPNKYILLK